MPAKKLHDYVYNGKRDTFVRNEIEILTFTWNLPLHLINRIFLTVQCTFIHTPTKNINVTEPQTAKTGKSH